MLRPEIEKLLSPLLAVLPLEGAMPELVPGKSASTEAIEAVRSLITTEAFSLNSAAQAALWLYVDELDTSHTISQGLHDATGSFLHGIMHRREGDFGNSHYWMRQTRGHPVWHTIPGYHPDRFIDAVAAARGTNPPDLVVMQRAEWAALMAYCLGL